MAAAAWVRVELDPEGRGLLRRGELEIAVFRTEAGVFAVANRCPHEGNPLVEGDVLGRTLVCAFHGWRFDLETGACLLGEERVRRYRAELRDGKVWVEAPAAEDAAAARGATP